jgi:acyl-coenzyme A synthetase/AMP-(fatty) acid ligase
MVMTHPGMEECAAIGVRDEKSGEAVRRIIAIADLQAAAC